MFNTEVNWFAIVASAVLYMVIGFIWYGPLFEKPWLKLIGKTKKDIEREMKEGSPAKIFGSSFLSALVMTYVTNVLVVLLNVTDVVSAIGFGVMLWLGYVAASYATLVVYEGKQFKLYLINVGYYLVSIVAAAVILTLWV